MMPNFCFSQVQEKWKIIEPVFTGFPDIRQTLAEDAKLFDAADETFRGLQLEAKNSPAALACCTRPGG
jgi:hypothetical protein